MGNENYKISDKDRVKIYKRVPLNEARKQYQVLSIEARNSWILSKCPVSRNFLCSYSHHQVHGVDEEILVLTPSKIEMAGNDLYSALLYTLLFYPLKLSGKEISEGIPDSLLIGLNKKQYDTLYQPE